MGPGANRINLYVDFVLANLCSSPNNSNKEPVDYLALQHKRSTPPTNVF